VLHRPGSTHEAVPTRVDVVLEAYSDEGSIPSASILKRSTAVQRRPNRGAVVLFQRKRRLHKVRPGITLADEVLASDRDSRPNPGGGSAAEYSKHLLVFYLYHQETSLAIWKVLRGALTLVMRMST